MSSGKFKLLGFFSRRSSESSRGTMTQVDSAWPASLLAIGRSSETAFSQVSSLAISTVAAFEKSGSVLNSMGCVLDDAMPFKDPGLVRNASFSLSGDEGEDDDRLAKDKLDRFARVREMRERTQNGGGAPASTLTAAGRLFCERCRKAQKVCICDRFKGVVDNKIKVTIIQHPVEKRQAIGSARIALLGLLNVSLVTLPEVDSNESYRIRPKVTGSKRSMAGRGGKGCLMKEGNLETADRSVSKAHVEGNGSGFFEISGDFGLGVFMPPKEAAPGKANRTERPTLFPLIPSKLENAFPAGVALLFPSEKALELSLSLFPAPLLKGSESIQNGSRLPEGQPTNLIVLDGTWSKAKRLYFENTWLHSIPHYKLPPTSRSLYEGVRRQPKLGCLSTLESIIYALKILEPETDGLDELLEVFDSMVEDQRRCKLLNQALNLSVDKSV